VVSLIAAIAQQHYILPIRTFADFAVGDLLFGKRSGVCLVIYHQFSIGLTQVQPHFSHHPATSVRVPHDNPVKFNAINGTSLDISGPGVDAGRAEYVLACCWRTNLLLPESEQANGALLQQIVTADVGTEAVVGVSGHGLDSSNRVGRPLGLLLIGGLYLLSFSGSRRQLIDLE